MKRKWLAVLLAGAMALGTMAGAGSAVLADEENVYVDEDGNTYQKFDDVKLTMLVCWNGGFQTAEDQYNNDVAAAIREKIGVTVEFEGIMMSETEKLNMMFASGDMPDMINAPFWGGTSGETGVIKKAGAEEMLIDIKDEVPKYPNIADAYDIGVVSRKYLENDLDDPMFEGARYVLPTELAGSLEDITNWAYGVFVRGDVPEALGVDVSEIKTSEQLYDFMKQAQEYGFKDINGNDCIIASTYHNGWSYGNYAASFDSKKLTSYSLDEDGKVTYDTLSENWIEKNLFIWKLVHEGILDKECFTTNDDLAKEKTGNGTVLFQCAQYGMSIDATKQTGLYDSNPEMRYIPVGPLNYADGQPAVQTQSEGRSGSPAIVFPVTCSNLDAALTWLDYVNSKEGTKLICYGFEGDTYELNEEGQPRMNAELTARYVEDSDSVKRELRERGIGYMSKRSYVAKKNALWFGEANPFDSEAANEYLDAYKKARPVEIVPGYPIDAVASGFEGYQEFAEWAFDGDRESDYTERAYFAETEEEAREILESYQEYLRTNDGGKMQEFLDYMTEQYATRDDFVF
jgi:putative aldouronate transport system substrate-binding protein